MFFKLSTYFLIDPISLHKQSIKAFVSLTVIT